MDPVKAVEINSIQIMKHTKQIINSTLFKLTFIGISDFLQYLNSLYRSIILYRPNYARQK